jgi:xanthine dehydrogenase small subunit
MPGFSRPATIDECVTLLREDPAATLIAGGSDLCVEANLKAKRWRHLVSLDAMAELREFADDDDAVRIGAALPLTDIGGRWTSAPPVIGEWLALFASPPIRNRATLGGNLATASPIGDSAPLLLTLDASVNIAGADGRRTIPLSDSSLAIAALPCDRASSS